MKLENIVKNITSGGTPSTYNDKFYDGDIPWLRTQEVNFNFIEDTERKITSEGMRNSSAKWIPKGSVIVAMYGNSAGRVAYTKIPLTTNQACCNITVDDSLADPLFLYYYLVKNYSNLEKLANGGAQQNLNVGIIKDFPFPNTPLSEQKRISSILSSFDNKIEQLKKENNILEDIAQNIFKEWFVKYNFPNKDGKPYKDNNGKMIDSELGGIPEEWIAGKLGDIGIRINERVGEEKNTIVLSAINSGELVKSQDFFEKKVYSNSLRNYIKCQKGDFAYNPARINIGSIGRNKLSDNCCVSPVYIVFRPSDSYGIWLEFLLTSKRFKQHTNLVANGSVRQSLNYDGFSIFPCIIPSKVIIEQFNNLISIIHNQTTISANKIKTLNILRNELINDLI